MMIWGYLLLKCSYYVLYHELYHIHWFRQFLFIWKWGRSGQELVLYELINFIVSSSFIMKHALKGYYSVCALFVLRQNWTTLLTWLNFFFLFLLHFYCLMKEACFFNCGENLSVKGMTYLTNSLFDYRSPENNSIRAEFILDAAHHKVRELHFSYKKISNAL